MASGVAERRLRRALKAVGALEREREIVWAIVDLAGARGRVLTEAEILAHAGFRSRRSFHQGISEALAHGFITRRREGVSNFYAVAEEYHLRAAAPK